MENGNASSVTSSASKAWLLFAASTIGMLVFAGLYFLSPKPTADNPTATPKIVTNTVVNLVTNEVVKEVPKEVEKIVKVPAEIPEGYVSAMNLVQRLTNATYIAPDQMLFKMKDVRAVYFLDDAVTQVMTVDEVKAKFELTLRRNNVPLNPNSLNVVRLSISGFTTIQNTLCYSINCYFDDQQWVFRAGEWHQATVRVWTKSNSFGTVGKSKANEALLKEVEKGAEIFANDFLSSNPKEK